LRTAAPTFAWSSIELRFLGLGFFFAGKKCRLSSPTFPARTSNLHSSRRTRQSLAVVPLQHHQDYLNLLLSHYFANLCLIDLYFIADFFGFQEIWFLAILYYSFRNFY